MFSVFGWYVCCAVNIGVVIHMHELRGGNVLNARRRLMHELPGGHLLSGRNGHLRSVRRRQVQLSGRNLCCLVRLVLGGHLLDGLRVGRHRVG